MATFEVVEGGFYTTVQDLGRYGFQRYGVPVSGAMDVYALRLANILLGNDEESAALEMTLIGPKLKFLEDTTVALAGANLAPRLNGRPAPMWHAFRVQRGSLLTFDGPLVGKRAYLAVPGGIDAPVLMGSRSTYVRGGLGGHEGRTLKSGDRISAIRRGDKHRPNPATIPDYLVPHRLNEHRLRVVMGPQADAFTAEGIATFFSSSFTVSQQSDRVGYRLQGPSIAHSRGADIVSDGIPFGAVQITGDGQPIILMADRGTTGGYTKIATVISVDLAEVAQTLPGNTVTFHAVSVEEAHRLLREQEEAMERFKGYVERSSQIHGAGLRVLVDNEPYEVQDQDGETAAQLEPLQGDVQTSRRTITATINDNSYTFDVELQDDGGALLTQLPQEDHPHLDPPQSITTTVNENSYTFEL